MTTLSARLGLKRWTSADAFQISEFTDNWNVIDAFPGEYICTSTSRPTTWTAAHAGMRIYETDTNLVWRWTGSAFVRRDPKGLLAHTAVAGDVSTALTAYQVGITVNAAVPAGNRRVGITVNAPSVASTASFTWMAIFRDNTMLQQWVNKGGVGATVQDREEPEFVTLFDQPPAATYAYSLQYRADTTYGGTSTLAATPNSPITITVVEV